MIAVLALLCAEEWRPVPIEPFCETHEVSSLGRVRRVAASGCNQHGPMIIRQRIVRGYLRTILGANGTRRDFPTHHLVLSAFVGPKPAGMQGCHNNGNRADNSLANLRWDTPEANYEDRDAHGRTVRGAASPHAKLTDDQVREIRLSSLSQRALARKFSVSRPTIADILEGKRWRHVT